jgi:hypothetical protein
MRTVFTVNELTLWRFWRAARRGENPYVLAVEPLLPFAGRLVHWLVERAYARKEAEHARALCPEFAHLHKRANLTSLYDIFARIEPWQNEAYHFAQADQDPLYGMVFKQITCKYLQDKYIAMLTVEALAKQGDAKIDGLQADTAKLYASYTGKAASNSHGLSVIGRLINLFLAGGVAIYALLWLLIRTRISPPREPVFLAADFLKDPRDIPLYQLAEAKGKVLLVGRNANFTPESMEGLEKYAFCLPDAGRVSPLQALRFITQAIGESFGVWRRYGWAEPMHFWPLITRVHYRASVRALLDRFAPKIYWGRDEYNADHIIRHQEMKTLGGKTMGLMHGVQGLADLNPRRRYIAFDVFYVFGRHLYDKYYHATWAPEMKVRPIGSFGFSEEQLAKADWRQSQTIVIFAAICIGVPEFTKAIRAIAAGFPDYRVLVKNKEAFKNHLPERQEFIAACTEGLSNIEFTGDVSAAGLIASARYMLSDASTVIAEGVHCGIPTLMLDMMPEHRACLFRDFPGLCVKTSEEAVTALKAFESGAVVFERKNFAGLVDLSGRHYHDMLKEDLGLSDA